MFNKLSSTISDISKKLSGRGKITASNIEESLEQIRTALLEADVNLQVVKKFMAQATEDAMGQKVLTSVDPSQQFIKIVNDKLISILGAKKSNLQLKGPDTVSTILMVGLQGVGKTSTTAKLAKKLKAEGRNVLLVACDVKRPAAIEQLRILSEQVGVPCFYDDKAKDPVKVAVAAIKQARKQNINTIIVDTAGRLEINEELLKEAKSIAKAVKPVETLYVADAMSGQSAAQVAQKFNETLEITGGILTKFDSDTRGGAALSFKGVTGKPIKFIGEGEKIDDLSDFHPDRIASRILGMGDIVSLVEKAQEMTTEKEAEKIAKKMEKGSFSLEMYLDQIRKMNKMGGVNSMMKMLPGMAEQAEKMGDIGTNKMKAAEAVICSMTKSERRNHRIIGPPRRKRIAKGSGTTVADVNKVLKEFDQMRLMMKKATSKNSKFQQQMRNMPQFQGMEDLDLSKMGM